MNEIILYSTGCPKCKVLKSKLDENGVSYIECNDIDEMKRLGLLESPALSVDGEMLGFYDAINWMVKYPPDFTC